MEIRVEVRSVYGVETVYPVCAKAKAFAAIAGQKTLTVATLRQVRALGYSIVLTSALCEAMGARHGIPAGVRVTG